MIDIHSHFLFDVDDGAKSIEETLRILNHAEKEGIKEIIATPHAFGSRYHVTREIVMKKIGDLTKLLQEENVQITVHFGQEIRLHEKIIQNLKTGEAMTLANSRYVLLELPSDSVPAYTTRIIQLIIADGKVPIIAHPERNRGIAENPERLEKLVRHGATAQVTGGSLSGHFGKDVQKLALRLIEANLIHTYGSDVHNLETRPLLFNEGLKYLKKKGHHEMIEVLLENNKRILTDTPFIILEPAIPSGKKWWGLVRM
ncbi:tyrosine-protein phosphatase [Sporosarcina siberiensis]|uniref:Tyrosine-protein phosphatase n=1 Tax=Sporosarcina siberiensis TaxID=1365606 RepID=A0ABW4SC40_9BACL